MTSKDKTKKGESGVFGIPPELKPAITNWVQERVKRIEAGKLPYVKDGLFYSLWKYANADKLAGKDLIAFTDLIPLEGTDQFTIYEFLDEIHRLDIKLENITFHLDIYKKYCLGEYEAIEAYMKDGRSESFNKAMRKLFKNQATFEEVFEILGKFDELAKLKLRLSGLLEFVEFSSVPSEKNIKPLKNWLDEYLQHFIDDKLFSFELGNVYKFSRQKEIFLYQIENQLRDYGAEFVFRQGEVVSVKKGIGVTIGKDDEYLFIHTLAALEKQGFFEVEQILITNMDVPPEKQTDDYKVKIRKSENLLGKQGNKEKGQKNKTKNESSINTDKKREWFDFFRKMGVIKEKSERAEELKKEFDRYSSLDGNFNGNIMRNLLKETDFTITEAPAEIKKMDWIFREYNSTPYSLDKSRSILIASLDKLSEKYETIPLVYTTLPLPSYVNYSSEVWREIFSVHSFEKGDYGHIDFLNALASLINDKVIGLLFFNTIWTDNKSIVFKATVTEYKKKPIEENETTPIKAGLSFDENSGVIKYGSKECEIPIKTNQYFLCQKMFQELFGKRVEEIEILDLANWYKDSKRSVYDAMRAVNKRVKNDLEIDELFKWRNNHIWLNEKLK